MLSALPLMALVYQYDLFVKIGASAASGSGKPYEGVVLHYAATDTEATGNEMQDIVKMVKEKTGIDIQFTIIPKAESGEVDKRLVSLQAGDELDIIYGTIHR